METTLFTVNEVAEMLRVDRTTVINYIKQGKIKAVKLGKQYRIHAKDIAYLLGGD